MANDIRLNLSVGGGAAVSNELRGVAGGLDRTADAASRMGSAMLTIGGAIAGLGVAALAREFVQTADAMALMEARLRTAAGSSAAFAQAQADVYKISQANSVGLQETAALYTKLSEPVQRLGGSAREVAGIVEAFSLSLKVGGASAEDASSATLQFAQAMGAGKLSGDEFNSIAEASPRFMRAMAEGMGVPIGKLKDMASEGKLTADVVGNALVQSLGQLKSEASSIPDTVGGSLKRLANDAQLAVADLNKIGGAGVTLGISGIVEEMRKLIPTVRDELAGAFQSVGDWIERNRDGLMQTWEGTKSALGDLWEIAKTIGSIVGAVSEWAVQSGLVKASIGTVRLLFAGVQDGAEIIGATLAVVGAQLLGVVGLFSDAAKAMSADAAAAAQATFEKFSTGGSAVARLNADMVATATKAAAAQAALAGAGVSASEMSREMRALAARSDAAAGPLVKLKNATTELTAEQKKAADAAKKQIAAGADLAAGLLAQEGGLSPDFAAKWDKLQAAYRGGAISVGVLEQAQAALLAQQPAMVAQAKASADAAKDEAQAREDLGKAFADSYAQARASAEQSAASVAQRVQSLLDEEKAVQLAAEQNISLARAVEQVAIERLQDAKAQALQMGNGGQAAAIQAEIDARERLADALDSKESREAADKFRKDEAAEWIKVWDQVGQSLSDALMDGGKSASEYIKGLFRNMVLRPMIQMASGSVASMFGAPASAGGITGGTGAGSLGQLGQFADLAKMAGSFSSFAGTGFMSAAVNGFGTTFGAAQGLYAAGNTAGAAGMGAGALGAGLAGIMGGRAIGQGISNGYAVGGGSGNAAVNVGTAIGMAIAGPLGAVVGGAIGGLTNRAFGRKLADTGIEGTLGGSAGFSGNAFTFEKGGWLRSDRTTRSQLDSETATALSSAVDMAKATTKAYAAALGLGSKAIDTYTQSIRISLKGLSEADQAKAIEAALAGFAEGLADTIGGGLDNLAMRGESTGAVLARLAGNLLTVNGTMDSLNVALLSASVSGADAATKLLEAFGGADQFAATTGNYLQQFYSDAERTSITTRQLTTTLSKLGLALPGTRDGFRRLVESQDLATDAGRNTYAALLSLSGAFASITEQAEAAVLSTSGLVDEIERLRGGSAGGGISLAELQAKFATATAQARAGDATALAGLPAISRAIESAAEATARSALDVTAMRAYLASSLSSTVQVLKGGAPAASTQAAGGVVATGTLPASVQSSAAGGADALLIEVKALRAELAGLRAEQQIQAATIASNTGKTARLIERVTPDGDAIATRAAA